LAPEYGKSTPIGPEMEDWLVVERVPDVFISGHVHVPGSGVYRGTTIVNCGAWQGQTDYQKRMGLVPQPGLLPVINRSEEHSSELQSRVDLVCRLLLGELI